MVDGALAVDVEAEIQDLALGPLLVGNGRFDAHVRVDGTAGGLEATGQVVLAETSVGGVPVIVDATGVRVDTTEVPAALVGQLTSQVQQQLSQGGYSDIRVVQPKVVTAADGTSAEVSGGGITLFFTNNDPANLYFVSYRLLGGKAAASVGPTFDVIGAPGAPPDAPASAGGPSTPTSGGSSSGAAAPTGESPGAPVGDPVYADAHTVVALDGIWPGWPWLIVAAGLLLLVGSLAQRHPKVRAWTSATLDQYVRG
jgi:hypothetical protein